MYTIKIGDLRHVKVSKRPDDLKDAYVIGDDGIRYVQVGKIKNLFPGKFTYNQLAMRIRQISSATDELRKLSVCLEISGLKQKRLGFVAAEMFKLTDHNRSYKQES